jgi:hypothetical protein
VTTGVVVGSILFASDDLFWVEQLAVGTSANFVGYGWFQVNEYASWYVFACSSFGEKGVEGIVTSAYSFVGWHLPVRLDAVLKAVKFPARVTDLKTGLSNVN